MGNPLKDRIQALMNSAGLQRRPPAGPSISTALKRIAPQKPGHVVGQPSAANAIQTPDIARKLVTRYGIREKNPAPTISPEVLPVVLVDDLIGESDLIAPRIRPVCGFAAAAPAAQVAAIQLQNPSSSSTILHVYYLVLNTSAAVDVFIRSHGAAADFLALGAGSTGFRNTLLANQITNGVVASSTAPPVFGGVQMARFRLSTSNPILIPFDHVMDPGHLLTVEMPVAGTLTLSANFFWSEEPTER